MVGYFVRSRYQSSPRGGPSARIATLPGRHAALENRRSVSECAQTDFHFVQVSSSKAPQILALDTMLLVEISKEPDWKSRLGTGVNTVRSAHEY